ncbi:hypothetical protein [Thalassotalea sp. 1_MG-2023]|uniref:hypothetical protein n=1 Tax=Thalassotalea sp. 1_MG-2023 TaxID=3062680 RepID=UPI0026E3A92F|nr:hypothetical protein [Thalassotalea sp. 1_MG-2023]
MKNVKFIYLYFLSGVLFLITAGAFYSTENSNLSPVFASIGFAIISISLVLFSQSKRCKTQNNNSE